VKAAGEFCQPPVEAESTCAWTAEPAIAGAVLLTGAAIRTVAVWPLVAGVEPPALDAVTTTRRV